MPSSVNAGRQDELKHFPTRVRLRSIRQAEEDSVPSCDLAAPLESSSMATGDIRPSSDRNFQRQSAPTPPLYKPGIAPTTNKTFNAGCASTPPSNDKRKSQRVNETFDAECAPFPASGSVRLNAHVRNSSGYLREEKHLRQ